MRVNDVAARETICTNAVRPVLRHSTTTRPNRWSRKFTATQQNMVADWAREVIALQSAGKITEALALVEARFGRLHRRRARRRLPPKRLFWQPGDLGMHCRSRRLRGKRHALPIRNRRWRMRVLSLAFVLQMLEEHRRAIDIASECDQIGREYGDESLRFRAATAGELYP